MLKLMDYLKNRFASMRFRVAAIVAVVGVFGAMFMNAGLVFASTMSHVTVMETNMNTSATSAVIVAFTAGASDAAGSLTLGMGSAVTAVAATQTVSTTYNGVDCKTITGASTDLPGTITSTSNTSPNIVLSSVGALTASTSYCFVLGTYAAQTAVTNAATANPYTVTLTDGGDSGTGSIDLISNDQVTVSATVPPSFTMSIANTTDNFSANLSTTTIGSTPGDTITINTNAGHGWYLWASDSNTGLHSGSSGGSIPSTTPGTNATLTAGTAGYVTAIPAANIVQGSGSGGTTSATAAFASSGSGNGSGLNTTPTIIASSTGTANAATVKPLEYAAIAGVTPAGTDYTDTITYVGAGSF